MFNNIYNTLSTIYGYINAGVRNNASIMSYIPIWFELIRPSINVQHIENAKPIFSYIYEAFTTYNTLKQSNNKIDYKNNNNSIITWISDTHMGNKKSKTDNVVSNKPIDAPKKKKETIPPKIRNAVWEKYHGNEEMGVCYCCGHMLYRNAFHTAHVFSESAGGEISIENLRISCQYCNLSMGNQNLYAYIKDNVKTKNLKGPGIKNVDAYFKKNPSQINSKRTNNWGNNKKQNITNNNPINNVVNKPIVNKPIVNKPTVNNNVTRKPIPNNFKKEKHGWEWS